ncbi:MAG: prepilin-type N-terminal cleavage/methylation domain-containing protein [Acidimicrobiales bacterium]
MHKQREKRHEDGEGGFTLIELLVVITILGVLAAIVVFSVGGISDTGNKSACRTTVRTVEVASEAYRAQNGAFAENLNALAEPEQFLKLDGLRVAGDTITMADDATVTYVPATGGTTDTCPET